MMQLLCAIWLFAFWLRFAPRQLEAPKPDIRRQYGRVYTGRRWVVGIRLQVVAVVV